MVEGSRKREISRMNQEPRSSASGWALVVAATCLALGACGRTSDAAKLTELQRLQSGILDIILLSPRDGLRHGKDSFIIEFRSTSDGRLVDAGDVHGTATMPMPGMPMFGAIDVTRTEVAGRYTADGQFGMAGTWRMTIEWQGPAGQGSVTFARAVQ